LCNKPLETASLLVEVPGEEHVEPMKRRSSAAGGIFIFLGLIVGAVHGINSGQPMLWLLRGFGVGIGLAVLVWLFDRWRR
jgi:hypothetical protein